MAEPAPPLERSVSRRDAANFCVVLNVACIGGSSVALEFEAVTDGASGPLEDPADAAILWPGGAESPSMVGYKGTNGRVAGTMVFQGLPVAEPLEFTFSRAGGYETVRLPQLSTLDAAETASSGLSATDRPSMAILDETLAAAGAHSPASGSTCDSRAPGPTNPEVFEVEVIGMSGVRMATFNSVPSDLVRDVRRRLEHACSLPLGEHRLILGNVVLEDRNPMSDYALSWPRVTLQCIQMAPSAFAQTLEARRNSADPEVAIDAAQAHLADGVLRKEFAASERTRPCTRRLAAAIPSSVRGELINWMVESFALLRLDSAILHNVVLKLDLYYAGHEGPVEISSLQRMLLAALCTELKMAPDNLLPGTDGLRRMLTHLCQGQPRLTPQSIFEAEREMLTQLDFLVSVPTPYSFLEQLLIRLGEVLTPVELSQRHQLAQFLLELALYDSDLQHGQPHAVLAAAALNAALHAFGAAPEQHDMLLEDLSNYYAHPCCLEDLVLDSERVLLELWLACSQGTSRWSIHCEKLELKFGLRVRHSAPVVSPGVILGRVHEVRSPLGSPLRSIAGSHEEAAAQRVWHDI